MSKFFTFGLEKVACLTANITVEAGSREEAEQRLATFLYNEDDTRKNWYDLHENIYVNGDWEDGSDGWDAELDSANLFGESSEPEKYHINAAGELLVDGILPRPGWLVKAA